MQITEFPGTPEHQALLRAIIAYYHDDPRILAVALFGSLARGNWDQYSDLDLDIVVRDDVQIDPIPEVQQLCASFAHVGERAALIVPNGEDAVDVVLRSLRELSVRYHPPATTSPNIVESVQLLAGEISADQIRSAGRANVRPHSIMEARPLDAFVRLALAADRTLHRRQLWHTLPLLEQMRAKLVEAFARSRGGGRPYSIFQANAPVEVQEQLGATLPEPTLRSAQRALLQLLEIVEQRRDEWGSALDDVGIEHLTIIGEIRRRQQSLHVSHTGI